jgi:hypothetical protein
MGTESVAITINKQVYHIDPEVARLIRWTTDQRDFYHKVLEIIAYEHLVNRTAGRQDSETLGRFRRLAHETLITDREE